MTERIVASDAAPDELVAFRTFEAFYEAEARTLYRRLWLVTGNRAEAEELMGDAFLSVWQRWDRVGGMDDPLVHSIALRSLIVSPPVRWSRRRIARPRDGLASNRTSAVPHATMQRPSERRTGWAAAADKARR